MNITLLTTSTCTGRRNRATTPVLESEEEGETRAESFMDSFEHRGALYEWGLRQRWQHESLFKSAATTYRALSAICPIQHPYDVTLDAILQEPSLF